MPSRGLAVLVATTVAAGGSLVWRSVAGRGSELDPIAASALSAIARGHPPPVSFLSEDDDVDASLREARTSGVRIIPREPRLIESATRAGTLLAGPRGVDYLEVLGYQVSWFPESTASSLPLARVRGRLRCTSVTEKAWSPLPGLEYTGRLGVVLPPATGGTLLLVVGDALPLDVQVRAVDGADVAVQRKVLTSIASAPPDYWLESGSPHDVPPDIQQLTIFADPARERQLSVRLGRRAPRVLARVQNYPAMTHAAVCAAPTAPGEAFGAGVEDFALLPVMPSYFGVGWSDALVQDQAGSVRWVGRYGALLIPFARRGNVRAMLHAYRQAKLGEGELSLRINDLVETPALPLHAGLHRYEWAVPSTAWVIGTNEILIRVTSQGDERLLGFSRLDLSLSR